MQNRERNAFMTALRAPEHIAKQRWRTSAPWKRGAFVAAIIFGFVIAGAAGSQMHFGPIAGLATLLGVFVGLGITVAVLIGARLLVSLGPLLARVPYVIVGMAIIVYIVVDLIGFFPDSGLLWGLGYLAVTLAFGAAIGHALGGGLTGGSNLVRVGVVAGLVVGLVAYSFAFYRLFSFGDDSHIQVPDAWVATGDLAGLPDPSQPGRFEGAYLTYGSGTDMQRHEFGDGAAFTTPTVDATQFADPADGFGGWLRDLYWGFDLESAPLNGRVWYPIASGPRPLVLIVHGNHAMYDHSDPGYAYLGRLLASHGYITVSVDENFINGYWAGAPESENDCRGWLLLEHLAQWRAWNDDPDHMFYKKVDMDRIALIGHSRGGEAVAIAAAFNTLRAYPDDATIEFDYGFNIRGVIAIAPVDGQYRPSNKRTPLKDVNYFVISGAHDADVSSYVGLRQYNRVEFSPGSDHFKASVWVLRANHGQFNSVWGNEDFGFPHSLWLNKRALMDGEDQRQIAKVYFNAFLDAVMNDDDRYLPLFVDPRAGAEWLPKDYYVSRFSDSSQRLIATFDEDIDLDTATLPGARIAASGFDLRREQFLPIRDNGTKEDTALYLGWRKSDGENAAIAIELPETLPEDFAIEGELAIAFSMARIDERIPEDDDEAKSEEVDAAVEESAAADEDTEVRFSIYVIENDGRESGVRVSDTMALPPILRSKFTKLADESHEYSKDWEPNLQDFYVPLKSLDLEMGQGVEGLRAIRIEFEKTAETVIAIDNIGFAEYPIR